MSAPETRATSKMGPLRVRAGFARQGAMATLGADLAAAAHVAR
jgi:hypothetical protein